MIMCYINLRTHSLREYKACKRPYILSPGCFPEQVEKRANWSARQYLLKTEIAVLLILVVELWYSDGAAEMIR